MHLEQEGSRRTISTAKNFRVDPRRIVHETIDDETIIIDLDVGTYYSLRGSAPTIWALLAAGGWSDSDIVGEMQRRYSDADPETVEAQTLRLIAELDEERLIESAAAAEVPHAAAAVATTPAAFERPVLERYTDMQYFLLLDPIHEVEEGGWPRATARKARHSSPG